MILARDFVRTPEIRVLPGPRLDYLGMAVRRYSLSITMTLSVYSLLAALISIGIVSRFYEPNTCEIGAFEWPKSSTNAFGWALYGLTLAAMTVLGPLGVAMSFPPTRLSWPFFSIGAAIVGWLLTLAALWAFSGLESSILDTIRLHARLVPKAPCAVVCAQALIIGMCWRYRSWRMEQWLETEL